MREKINKIILFMFYVANKTFIVEPIKSSDVFFPPPQVFHNYISKPLQC